MDRNSQEKPEIRQLIENAAAARSRLETDAVALREKLDVQHRLKDSLRSHPGAWMAGSMASGLTASFLLRRKRRNHKKQRRISTKLLGLTLTAARPLLKVWLANLAKQWLVDMANRQTVGRMAATPASRKPTF